MQIIKKGYLPKEEREQVYEGKCARCGCEFTYTSHDIKWQATEYYWNLFDLED